ncbi:MAG: AAA family ATPase [Brevinematales bacterium]
MKEQKNFPVNLKKQKGGKNMFKENNIQLNLFENYKPTNNIKTLKINNKITISFSENKETNQKDTQLIEIIKRISELKIQENLKQQLIISISSHISNLKNNLKITDTIKPNLLILGQTGSGKTYAIQKLAEILEDFYIPVTIYNTTYLTKSGYAGQKPTDIIIQAIKDAYNLYNNKKINNNSSSPITQSIFGSIPDKEFYNIFGVKYPASEDNKEEDENKKKQQELQTIKQLTETCIIYLDEIDKIKKNTYRDSSLDAIGEGVQQDLLKIIEGTNIEVQFSTENSKPITMTINTKNILFIAGGAFTDITSTKKDNPQNLIGFSTSYHDNENYKKIETPHLFEKLISYGMIPEFIGRFPCILQIEPLPFEKLKEIFFNSKSSILHNYITNFFSSLGINIKITDALLNEIFKLAQTKKEIGARAFHHAMIEYLHEIMKQISPILIKNYNKNSSIEIKIE